MKLGILLSSGPDSEDVHTAARIAEAASGRGHQVRLFLMCDGVFHAARLSALVQRGVSVALCSTNAQQRGVPRVEGVLFGSQHDWAAIVHDSDRVITFA